MNERSLRLVNEMYAQLGGNIFKLMTKAVIHPLENIAVENYKSVVSLFIALQYSKPEDFIFNKNMVNVVYMHLMGNDTYTFEFIKKGADEPFKTITDVYFDEVQDVFELNINLLVTLHNRKNSRVVVRINA